jgi:hypothetical protein
VNSSARSAFAKTRARGRRCVDGRARTRRLTSCRSTRRRWAFLHHDLEDVIGIVDERPTLIDELTKAPDDVRAFIAERVEWLMAQPSFLEALPGLLMGDEVSQQRLPGLLAKLRRIVALGTVKAPSTASRSPRPVTRRSQPAAAGGPPVGRSHGSSPGRGATAGTAKRVYLQSSNLEWVEYDTQRSSLVVGFHGGRSYRFNGVPSGI